MKLLVALLISISLVSVASAQQPDKETRKKANAHFKQGKAFYDAKEWARAIAEIQTAEAQIVAAERCTQSASSESRLEFGSTAECPESESPLANRSPTTSAGQRSRRRSVSHARNTSAATSA